MNVTWTFIVPTMWAKPWKLLEIQKHSQNEEFVFNESEIQFYKRIDATTPGYTDVAARKAPGMFLNLNKTFFQTKIMNLACK